MKSPILKIISRLETRGLLELVTISFQKIFFFFFCYKESMEANDSWGVANFDPWGMDDRIYLRDH